MANKSNRDYRPSFSVSSYQKPVHQRLTPLAWIVVAVGVFFVLFGFVVVASSLTYGSPSELARQFGLVRDEPAQAADAPTAPPVMETAPAQVAQGATATPAPRKQRPTSTPAPTRTPGPTAAPLATAEATVEVVTAVAWTDQMQQTASGEWMAPAREVQRTERDVLAYFNALRAQETPQDAYRDLVEKQDTFLSRFFEGEALREIKSRLSTEHLALLRGGNTYVQVVRYTKNGTAAVVSISKRGWQLEMYDRNTLAPGETTTARDEDLMWQVRYSAVEGRWKITNISALPANGQVFSPEGQQAFDDFFKKNAQPTPPQP
jgi:hypothetical protein